MHSIFSLFFKFVNESHYWNMPIKLRGKKYSAITFDRLLALLIHNAFPKLNPFTVWLKKRGRKGDVVLDIGANQGLFSLAASDIVCENGLVHAFEPDPSLFQAFKGNLERNRVRNVVAHAFALGAEAGNLHFYKNPYNGGGNRLTSSDSSNDHAKTTVEVMPLDSLDDVVKFDLVKMDVQGWELAVFQGMEKKLESNPNARILFEFWPYGMKLAGYDPADLLNYLIKKGYALHEQPSNKEINLEQISDFVKKFRGKRYTDIEAVRVQYKHH